MLNDVTAWLYPEWPSLVVILLFNLLAKRVNMLSGEGHYFLTCTPTLKHLIQGWFLKNFSYFKKICKTVLQSLKVGTIFMNESFDFQNSFAFRRGLSLSSSVSNPKLMPVLTVSWFNLAAESVTFVLDSNFNLNVFIYTVNLYQLGLPERTPSGI